MLLSFILSFFISLSMPAHVAAHVPYQRVVPVSLNKTLILQLVNNARKNGVTCKGKYYPPVQPLVWNDELETAAINHSKDMMKNNYFSHTSTEGTDVGSRLESAGYRWKNYGENIGMGYNTEQEVVEGWLNSPGHCKNIMNKDFKEMGIAKAGAYWTLDFGTR